ncbi:MAG TPA: flagellar biosynthetic protein FliO [Stellaceae bacterium]|nr:flagellar biosynthetic protein FliO [Stellaceae bacterium]
MIADNYWRFVLALAAVVALIFAVAWVARRLGLGGRLVSTGGKRRRLAVVEVLPLDAKRRLVLLRRDGAEHLILLGIGGDVVVERAIGAPAADAVFTLENPVS